MPMDGSAWRDCSHRDDQQEGVERRERKKQSATTMDAEGLKEGIGFVPIKEGIGCMPMDGRVDWIDTTRRRLDRRAREKTDTTATSIGVRVRKRRRTP